MNLEQKLLRGGKKLLKNFILASTLSSMAFSSISCESDTPTNPVKENPAQTRQPPRQQPPQKNRSPLITSSPIETVNEGKTYFYQFSVRDPDGDVLGYSLQTGPSWLTLVSNALTGTAPKVDKDENFAIDIRAKDYRGGVVNQKYTLTVKNTDTAKVRKLSKTELERLTKITETNIEFSEPTEISRGDIIVGGISNETPYGILREVTNVSQNKKTVQTKQAALEQAIENGSFSFSQQLSSNEINSYKSLPGVSKKTTAGFEFSVNLDNVNLGIDAKGNEFPGALEANGAISFNIQPVLEAEIKWFKMKRLKAQLIMSEEADIELRSSLPAHAPAFQKDIAGYYLTPIPVLGTPFVITPRIDITIGVLPLRMTPLEARVLQQANLKPGVLYDNGSWSNISDLSHSFDFFISSIQDTSPAEVEVYVGPSLKLFLNGVLPGVQTFIGNRIKLAQRNQGNGWELYGGIYANIGIDMNAFSRFIDDYSKQIVRKEKLLAEKDGSEQKRNQHLEAGERIAFVKIKDSDSDIYILDSRNEHNITNTPGEIEISPSWSPQGDKIVYLSQADKYEHFYIHTINPDGSEKRNLRVSGKGASFSQDGKEIVYGSDSGLALMIMNSDGTNPRNILPIKKSEGLFYCWAPFWQRTPWILFSSNMDYKLDGSGKSDIYLIDKDGSNLKRLTNGKSENTYPASSPSGIIAFTSNRDGDNEIYTMDPNGQDQINMTESPSTEDYSPSWSPQGDKIIYSSNDQNLWIIEYQTRQKSHLINNGTQPSWAPR